MTPWHWQCLQRSFWPSLAVTSCSCLCSPAPGRLRGGPCPPQLALDFWVAWSYLIKIVNWPFRKWGSCCPSPREGFPHTKKKTQTNREAFSKNPPLRPRLCSLRWACTALAHRRAQLAQLRWPRQPAAHKTSQKAQEQHTEILMPVINLLCRAPPPRGIGMDWAQLCVKTREFGLGRRNTGVCSNSQTEPGGGKAFPYVYDCLCSSPPQYVNQWPEVVLTGNKFNHEKIPWAESVLPATAPPGMQGCGPPRGFWGDPHAGASPGEEKMRKSYSSWGWGAIGACPSGTTAKAREKTLNKSPPRLDFSLLLALETRVWKHMHTQKQTLSLFTGYLHNREERRYYQNPGPSY